MNPTLALFLKLTAVIAVGIVLLVVVIYGPILISALSNSSTEVKIEGINYFFDTLLFAGVILALASATPPAD